MRRVQGVTDQHRIFKRPALVPYPREIAPHGFVRHQPMSVERRGEDLLANRLRLLNGLVRKAVTLPGLSVAFDQKCAHRWRVPIMMRIERSKFGFDKGLRQCLESYWRAVPGDFVGRMGKR